MNRALDTLSHVIPESVATTANALYHVSNLSVLILHESQLIQTIGDLQAQKFYDYLVKTTLLEDAKNSKVSNAPYILTLGETASVLYFPLSGKYNLLIGPYKAQTPKCPLSDPFVSQLDGEDRESFIQLCSRFDLRTDLSILALLQTATALYQQSFKGIQNNYPFTLKGRSLDDSSKTTKGKQIFTHVQEEENPNIFLMIRDLVCTGNAERAGEIYQKSIEHIARPLPNTQCPRRQEVYRRIGLLHSIFYKLVECSVDHHNLTSLKDKYLEQLHRTRCTREMDLIVLDFLNAFSGFAKQNMQIESYTELIQKAILYIHENVKSKISLKDVAASLHVNACYLSSIFKKETGKALTVYITELKITQAKRLLESTSLPITSICYEIGFDNPSYFTEVFKKFAGTTPKDYKQLHKSA